MDQRTTNAITCNGCDHTWTALGAAHCGGCHRTFSSVGHFDKHRNQHGERGECINPAGIEGIYFRGGMWRGPEMSDEQRRRAYT